jgi:hypothetical protein
MSVSTYFANASLDRQFGNTTYAVPATLYVGLSTATITADTTGSTVTEPAAAQNYARVAVTNTDKTNWNNASAGVLTNRTTVTFPESGAVGWGTITYIFIADALTGGNIICYEALSTPRAVGPTTTVIFASSPAAIQISMTNS